MIALEIFKNGDSLLPCSEQHIRISRGTQFTHANIGRSAFPFLKLEIISRDDMGKQGLDFP
jgi:hypothetical protein